jgi:hypothetical protein
MSIAKNTPMRPEQLELQVDDINKLAERLIPDTVTGALGLRAVVIQAVREYIDTLDYGNFPPRFEPGERVEAVHRGNGGYGAEEKRPGTVVEIDLVPVVQAHLRVRFDDGEERHINPDVMRSIRDESGNKIFTTVTTPVATFIVTEKEA